MKVSWKEIAQKVRGFISNRWFQLGFWGILYLLWVIWLGNFWWLIGLGVIFDACITKKVKWAFWKKTYKEGEKHNVWLDWLDAIVFADHPVHAQHPFRWRVLFHAHPERVSQDGRIRTCETR